MAALRALALASRPIASVRRVTVIGKTSGSEVIKTPLNYCRPRTTDYVKTKTATILHRPALNRPCAGKSRRNAPAQQITAAGPPRSATLANHREQDVAPPLRTDAGNRNHRAGQGLARHQRPADRAPDWIALCGAVRKANDARKGPTSAKGINRTAGPGNAPLCWGLKNGAHKILKHTGTVFHWRGKVVTNAAFEIGSPRCARPLVAEVLRVADRLVALAEERSRRGGSG
jgi:hypothetical protein